MFIGTCKKMKNLLLKRKIKTDKKDKYPTGYKTGIDVLYKFDLNVIYPIISRRLSENEVSTDVSFNSDTIFVSLNSIKILSSNASKLIRFDSSYVQEIIEETLKRLLLNSRDASLDDIEDILYNLAFFKIPYNSRHTIYNSFKADLGRIKDTIEGEIAIIAPFVKHEFLKKIKPKLFSPEAEKDNAFIDFFLPIVLFTIDKIKELTHKQEYIEIFGTRLDNLFSLGVDSGGDLGWHHDFDLKGWVDSIYIKFGMGKDIFTMDDFLTLFFINDLKQHLKNKTGKSIQFKKAYYVLKMAVLHSISFFILHYILSLINFRHLIKISQIPKTIRLTIKEENDALVIEDNNKSLTFEKYNKKFFDEAAPLLIGYNPVAFFVESGVVRSKVVDHNFFEDKKFSISDSFLFVLKKSYQPIISPSTKRLIDVETYGSFEAILRALYFLTDEHYEKSFLYEAVSKFLK